MLAAQDMSKVVVPLSEKEFENAERECPVCMEPVKPDIDAWQVNETSLVN